MRFEIDLSSVPKLQPLPQGTYIVQITDVKVGESQSGNPKLTIETKVLEPANIAQEVPKWFFSLSLHENALFRVRELFEAIGKLHAGGFDTDELLGEVVGVTVRLEQSDFTGRPQNQIVAFMPAESATPNVTPEAMAEAKTLLASAQE